MISSTQEFPNNDGVDFRALFARLVAKRLRIIGCTFLFTSVSFTAAFLMAPVYRATTVLIPANVERNADVSTAFEASSLGGLASGLGLEQRDAETEEALAVLRSREFTENFIVSEDLMPKLYEQLWNPTTGRWNTDVKKPPTLAEAYKYFDNRIRSITEDRKTGLITIQIDWTDRNVVAIWANDLVRRLNDEMRARTIDEAEASVQFLNRELQSTTTLEGRDAISRLLESQLNKRMLATVTHDYAFRVVDRAMPADSDDRVRPQRSLMVTAGFLLGLGMSIVSVLAFAPVSGNARPPPSA